MLRRHAVVSTSLGDLLFVADGEAIAGVYFPGHWHPPAPDAIGVLVDARSDRILRELDTQLGEYLAGERTAFQLEEVTTGDPFQEKVWGLLREIPYGATVSYGELADRIGDRRYARRVGGAVGRNPISILVPCHRVVGANGALTGYAGGLDRKHRLLELEGARIVSQRRLF